MYERRHEPLLPVRQFWARLIRHALAGLLVLGVALGVGMAGYAALEGMAPVDAFLNAAMILSGMGPVAEMHTYHGKLFAGVYALFSGLVFVGLLGLVVAPVLHRVLHTFHVARHRDDREDSR